MKPGSGVLAPSALSGQNVKPADWRKGCRIWCHYLRKDNMYRFGAESTKLLMALKVTMQQHQGFYGKAM